MDIIKSLENLLPRYETTLPFLQKKVTFTPFRVKDAKNISIVLQEENKKLALNAMVDLLKSNTEGVDVLNLCLADAEFLFLQIRAKSVDEYLNLIYNKEKIQVFIYDIKNKNSLVEDTIKLNDKMSLMLHTPKVKDLLKLPSLDQEYLIKSCIHKIILNGEIFYVDRFINDEMKDMIDNLPLNVVPKLEQFLNKMPELYVMLNTSEGEKEVSGILSFFISR
jgi:hypothetical protein